MKSGNGRRSRHRRVLIVEDDVMQAESVEAIVAAGGYEVCGKTRSGTGAVYLARLTEPDVVLMDVQLAGDVNGIDAAAMIRRTHACALVFITAHGGPATTQNIRRLFPDSIAVAKPASPGAITAAIDEALSRSGLG
jgi:DNA-binding NarL/FixJ family response regulator